MSNGSAIKPEILEQLKEQLKTDYVPYLPPLLGNQRPDKNEIKQVSRAFSAFVLSKKFNLSEKEACKFVVDDYDDNGIDALYFNESNSTLYLLQSKLKSDEALKQDEVLKFTQGVSLLLQKDFASFNENFQNIRGVLEAALDQCEHIVLALAYTGTGMTQSASATMQREVKKLQRSDYGDERLELDVQKFVGRHAEKYLTEVFAQERVSETIELCHYAKLREAGDIVLGAMKVADLVALHQKYGNALYDKNIRYFLGEGKKGVNVAIKNTLLSEPEKFIYLNNGITAVGEQVNPKSVVSNDSPARYIEVNGLSVVNGAQTIASAAQCLDEENLTSCDAMVTVTLIEAGDGADLHKQITRARNLQNPVELSDFVALDDTQERLRREIKLQGYEYYYRPQQGIDEAITIDVVAKALACLHDNISFPAQLKNSSRPFEDIDSDQYKFIFPHDISAVTVINTYHLFSKIKSLLFNAEKSTGSPEKLIYRHCLYPLAYIVLSYFSSRVSTLILEPTLINKMMSKPFDEIRQALVDSFPGYETPYAYFKRSSDVERLIQKSIAKYCDLKDEKAYQTLRSGRDEDRLNSYLLSQLKKKGKNA